MRVSATALLFAVAAAAAIPSALAGTRCESRGGTCGLRSECGGRTESGLCPGASEIRCCFADTPTRRETGRVQAPGSRCEGRGGSCVDGRIAGACPSEAFESGLCPGASYVRCCLADSAPSRVPRPVARPANLGGGDGDDDDGDDDGTVGTMFADNGEVPKPEPRGANDVFGKEDGCKGGVTCAATRTSVQVSVGQAAIDYFRTELLEPVLRSKKIMGEEADFFKEMTDSERIKKVKLGIKIRLDSCFLEGIEIDEDRTKIDFVPASNLVDIDLRGLKLTLRLEIGYNGMFSRKYKPRVLEVEIKEAHFKAMFRVGWKKERPSVVSVTEPNLTLDRKNFDIRFLKGEKEKKGWFINFIIDLVEGLVARIARNKVASEFNKQVNPLLNKILSTLPIKHTIPAIEDLKTSPIVIDSRLSRAPIVTDNGLNLLFKGTAYRQGGSCDSCPMPRLAVADSDKFAHVRISEHLPCCVAHTVHKMGALSIEQEVPKPAFEAKEGDKVQAAVGNLLASVFNVFSLRYKVDVPAPPEIRFKEGGVRVFAKAKVELHLVRNAAPKDINEKTELLAAEISAAGHVNVDLDGNLLSYQIADVTAALDKVEIKNQKIDASIRKPLNKFIDWVIEKEVISKANAAMAKGFEIPTVAGLNFVKPHLDINEGYIDIGTDATFKLPEDFLLEMYSAAIAA